MRISRSPEVHMNSDRVSLTFLNICGKSPEIK